MDTIKEGYLTQQGRLQVSTHTHTHACMPPPTQFHHYPHTISVVRYHLISYLWDLQSKPMNIIMTILSDPLFSNSEVVASLPPFPTLCHFTLQNHFPVMVSPCVNLQLTYDPFQHSDCSLWSTAIYCVTECNCHSYPRNVYCALCTVV